METKNLSAICQYRRETVSVTNCDKKTFISTENMLPNKAGISLASKCPTSGNVSKYHPGDVLVSNIRPYFKKIHLANTSGTCSNDVLVFQPNHDVCTSEYLFCVLSTDDFFSYATTTAKGTKMPRGDRNAIMNYQINWIPVHEQSKIAEPILNTYRKIKLNEQINDNLLQQARALYQAWFVDYVPFNGVRPSDWIDDTINGLAKEVICGKTPSTKAPEYYGNDIPFITIPDMHGNTYAVTTERYLSSYGAQSQHKKTLPRNSICVSCIGTAGLVTLTAQESQTNQQINSIIPKEGYSPYYIYLLMETLSVIINNLGQSGSTIVNLNKAQFGKIAVVIPSIETMKSFDEIVSPMFESILSNQKENIKLAELRDSLLPRLMSGKLDISEIYI